MFYGGDKMAKRKKLDNPYLLNLPSDVFVKELKTICVREGKTMKRFMLDAITASMKISEDKHWEETN
jgi:hypothetical protein